MKNFEIKFTTYKKSLTFIVKYAKIPLLNRGADEHEYSSSSRFLDRCLHRNGEKRVSPPKRNPVRITLGIWDNTCMTVTPVKSYLVFPYSFGLFWSFLAGGLCPSFILEINKEFLYYETV